MALSFVVMALFVREGPGGRAPWRVELTGSWFGRLPTQAWIVAPLQALSVAVFLLILLAAFFGDPNPTRNFAPTFVWVVWWIGFAYLQALIGDLWRVVNPWRVVFIWAETLLRQAGWRACPAAYPAWLGHWPAVLFFWIFAWLELVSDAAERPASLGVLILIYSGLTWAGMAAFGRETWLDRGEAFTVVFGLLARFAPLASGGRPAGETGDEVEDTKGLTLRPYGVGLLTARPLGTSATCLVLLMLATVTYDGIGETPLWAGFLDWVVVSESLRAPLLALQRSGVDLLAFLRTLGLLVTPLLFFAVYAFFSRLTARAVVRAGGPGGPGASTCVAAGAFVLTLVPIALAYHLAHYLSFLLLAGQFLLPLASDPLGLGWDLFGTANRAIDIGIVSIKAVWWIAVVAVVVGHVYAVYLAHAMALRLYGSGRAALVSQLPLVLLMIAYTMISLWILSQPIVETG
ncbi:MAG: hypothetical protein R3285_06505 [Kiloniellales bacterium]|nr:hypothetical protein [Kiloniellales bacterium]